MHGGACRAVPRLGDSDRGRFVGEIEGKERASQHWPFRRGTGLTATRTSRLNASLAVLTLLLFVVAPRVVVSHVLRLASHHEERQDELVEGQLACRPLYPKLSRHLLKLSRVERLPAATPEVFTACRLEELATMHEAFLFLPRECPVHNVDDASGGRHLQRRADVPLQRCVLACLLGTNRDKRAGYGGLREIGLPPPSGSSHPGDSLP